MRELEAYRDVTRAFPHFLGLRMVPVGVWFLLVPALGPFDARPALVAPLLAAVAASWGIGRWYRRRFGSVETGQASLGRNWPILLGLVAASLALAAASFARVLGPAMLVAVLVLILFATVVLVGWPRRFDRRSLAAVAVTGVVAIAGAVLLAVASHDPGRIGSTGDLFSVVVGSILCCSGLLEHRSLVRALAEPGGGDA